MLRGASLGLSLDLALRNGVSVAFGPVTDPIVQSVNANGWSVTTTSTPPTMDPDGAGAKFLYAIRKGYDASGNATTFTEKLTLTKRIRQAYPNQGSLTSDQVSVSDYVYADDSATGVTNNSTEASPKPVANWALPDHRVVGNTLRLEVVAFHRNARLGKQVACVEFRATDGVNTVTQIISSPSILGHPGDLNPVVGYACDLDITSLTAGAITANARVFPHVGVAASILNSSDSSVAREFSPQTYLKNVTLAANPVYAYVNVSTGNDTTGAISTTAATAEAAPCATVAGAINRAIAVNASMDGVVIRLMTGTHVLSTTAIIATRAQTTGEVIITRDPNATRAGVIVQFGSAAARFRLGASGGWLHIKDVTLSRTGTSGFTGEATSQLRLWFDQVDLDNGSAAATLYTNAHGVFTGAAFTNVGSTVLNAAGAVGVTEHRMFRGVSATGTSTNAVEGWLVLGCNFTSCGTFTRGNRSASGSIIAFNKCRNMFSGGATVSWGLSQDVTGYAVVQNLLEFTSATSSTTIGLSHDDATGNNTHGIVHHNTFVGFFINGRSNMFYDDGSTARTCKLHSCVGNIHVQLNTKGDVFVTNGARVGNWAYLYAVGCRAEFSQFMDANSGGLGTSFAQEYGGLRSKIGTSASVRQDPLFTNYQGTTSGPTAGAGGGDYTLQAGSPCIGMNDSGVLPFDLAGNARSATASAAGAYERLAP